MCTFCWKRTEQLKRECLRYFLVDYLLFIYFLYFSELSFFSGFPRIFRLSNFHVLLQLGLEEVRALIRRLVSLPGHKRDDVLHHRVADGHEGVDREERLVARHEHIRERDEVRKDRVLHGLQRVISEEVLRLILIDIDTQASDLPPM